MKPEIRALTGVRGVAACLVVFYHYFQDSSGFGPAHSFIQHGYVAVDLFFVLSGFVMALTYASSFSSGFSASAYFSFLCKRLGRVYPLYIAVTAAIVGLSLLHLIESPPFTPTVLISNVLLAQAWGVGDSIDGPGWSISTEFAAYLAFPILVGLVLVGKSYRCWLAAACSATALFILSRLSTSELNQVVAGVPSRSGPLDIVGVGTPFALVRCFAGFVLGLVAYRLSTSDSGARFFGRKHVGNVAALVVLALWAIHGTDIWLELAFVPMIVALAVGSSQVAQFMASPVIFWLGEISYSIYLVHRPLSDLVRNPLAAALNAGHVPHAYTLSGFVPLALTFIVSPLTFYGLEKPARNWARRLMGSRPPPIAIEPAAP